MSPAPKFHEPLPGDFDSVLTVIGDATKPISRRVTARPFLKWVGGKRSILPELIKRVPQSYNTYYEPFVGGGALYFAVQPEQAYLSDINFHLIITFQAVKNDVITLIRYLKIHEAKHSKEYYLEARKKLFTEKDKTKIAAWFIYLNKTCYNGLYRVNKNGFFNVPMGDYKTPPIVDEVNLHNTSQVLQRTTIAQHGFSQVEVYKDNFYYLDPPYHSTYDGYSGNGFGDKEHRKLADLCHEIDRKGGYFMLSNSDTDLVNELYKRYNREQVMASRSVSCKSHQRGKENELIIRNYT